MYKEIIEIYSKYIDILEEYYQELSKDCGKVDNLYVNGIEINGILHTHDLNHIYKIIRGHFYNEEDLVLLTKKVFDKVITKQYHEEQLKHNYTFLDYGDMKIIFSLLYKYFRKNIEESNLTYIDEINKELKVSDYDYLLNQVGYDVMDNFKKECREMYESISDKLETPLLIRTHNITFECDIAITRTDFQEFLNYYRDNLDTKIILIANKCSSYTRAKHILYYLYILELENKSRIDSNFDYIEKLS